MIGIYSKGEAPDSGKYELWVDGAGFSEFQVAESCGIGNRHFWNGLDFSRILRSWKTPTTEAESVGLPVKGITRSEAVILEEGGSQEGLGEPIRAIRS